MEKVSWEEIYELGENMIDSIGSQVSSKKYFLKISWDSLENANLTSYRTELGLHIVYIRFLVIYETMAKFFEKIGYDSYYPSYEEFIYDFGMSEIRIGQLLKVKLDGESREDLLQLSLESIMSDIEEQVLRCLLEQFKGESMLFVALYLALEGSYENPYYYSEDNDDDQDIEEYIEISSLEEYEQAIEVMSYDILNNVTEDKLIAFEWLRMRCNI